MEQGLLNLRDLAAALPEIARSPRERGSVELIVRRPRSGEREVLDTAMLDVDEGLVGDRWALGKRRRSNQLTLINSRLVALLAETRDRWPLAGDQLYVDFDLSEAHPPPARASGLAPPRSRSAPSRTWAAGCSASAMAATRSSS